MSIHCLHVAHHHANHCVQFGSLVNFFTFLVKSKNVSTSTNTKSDTSSLIYHLRGRTMNSIKYACSLNNQGVELLVSGESPEAMKVFQCAVGLLKMAVHEAETTSCTAVNISASLPFCQSTSTVSGLQGLHCYVYDHGIMILDNGNVNVDTEQTISHYIAIALFNSALVSHSEGTALGQEKAMIKASKLYSLVGQLVASSTIPEDTFTPILTLLALNNKAQIHYAQCEYVQSVDCMKTISNIMGSVRGLHSALNHEDTEQLFLNVMLVSIPMAAQAA
jgi:hypothetical protein